MVGLPNVQGLWERKNIVVSRITNVDVMSVLCIISKYNCADRCMAMRGNSIAVCRRMMLLPTACVPMVTALSVIKKFYDHLQKIRIFCKISIK